jgi:uncharacterized protein (UPF0276 family)
VTKTTDLGVGIGLRVPHIKEILHTQPKVDFFEIISENFMIEGGLPLYHLDRILENYPVVMHGVSMSIASAETLDMSYLKRLKTLQEYTKSPWVSDHLCWSKTGNSHHHDLLPMPYSQIFVDHIVDKIKCVQDTLQVPFAIENLSSYVSFKESTMPEWEFIQRILDGSDASLLLDLNNIFVSSVNHGFEPMDYLDHLDRDRILQIHLAGPSELENGMMLDTHDHPVRDEVWNLYETIIKGGKPITTLLEWDDQFLSLEETLKEAHKAYQYRPQVCSVNI